MVQRPRGARLQQPLVLAREQQLWVGQVLAEQEAVRLVGAAPQRADPEAPVPRVESHRLRLARGPQLAEPQEQFRPAVGVAPPLQVRLLPNRVVAQHVRVPEKVVRQLAPPVHVADVARRLLRHLREAAVVLVLELTRQHLAVPKKRINESQTSRPLC